MNRVPLSEKRDPGASVLALLRNQARVVGLEMPFLLARYVNERFLYRLSCSRHSHRFALRGATLFLGWLDNVHRPTRDIDLLAIHAGEVDELRGWLADIAKVDAGEDGVLFEPESIQVGARSMDGPIRCFHATMAARIGTARPRLDLDIAVGEAVPMQLESLKLPSLLGMPVATVSAYPREIVVAEKLEAIVSLGLLNTRLKDYYDLWFLSSHFDFDSGTLRTAVDATFRRQATLIPEKGLPNGLTTAFAIDPGKRRQWQSFISKPGFGSPPATLHETIDRIVTFVAPLLVAVRSHTPFDAIWPPNGPWGECRPSKGFWPKNHGMITSGFDPRVSTRAKRRAAVSNWPFTSLLNKSAGAVRRRAFPRGATHPAGL